MCSIMNINCLLFSQCQFFISDKSFYVKTKLLSVSRVRIGEHSIKLVSLKLLTESDVILNNKIHFFSNKTDTADMHKFILVFSALLSLSSSYIVDYGPVVKATKGNIKQI